MRTDYDTIRRACRGAPPCSSCSRWRPLRAPSASHARQLALLSDSFHYMLLGDALAHGRGFVSGGSQHPDLTRAPLLPC
jgi:hypothetical protein